MFDKDKITGIVAVIIHVFFFALLEAYIRLNSGYFSIMVMNFLSYMSCLMFLFVWYAIKMEFPFRTKVLHMHILRAVVNVISYVTLYIAILHMPFAEANAVTLVYPLVSTVTAVIFLRESIGIRRSVGLVIGFIGALIIIQPGVNNFNWYSLFIIVTVICWAIVDLLSKMILRTDTNSVQLFYVMFLGALFTVPFVVFESFGDATFYKISEFCFVTGLLELLNFGACLIAYANAPITLIVPFFFLQIIFSVIIAYFVFHEIVGEWTVIGSLIIGTSILYIAYREHKVTRNKKKFANLNLQNIQK